jgi:hypothetical protein
VPLPTDCDDEYWEDVDPAFAFKQPPGKPSKVAFFISLLKLQRILAFAIRTIVSTVSAQIREKGISGAEKSAQYSINKGRLGGPEWQQRTVSELDSAINKWADTIPEHSARVSTFLPGID